MYVHVPLKVKLFIDLKLADDLFGRIMIHHGLMMRVPFEWFVTVTHLPLKSLTVSFVPNAVQNMLAWWFIATVTKLNRIHFVLLGLLRLYGVDYLVGINSGELISEALHELVSPVFARVSIKGPGMMLG